MTVELPTLLRPVADGRAELELDADSLRGVLDALVAAHPGLEVHLFDERGELRQHVLCFHNRTNSRWSDAADRAVADGDTVTILQAVSGG